MQIILECHGVFRSLCGSDEQALELPGDRASIAEVLDALAEHTPETAKHLPRTACALGDRLAEREETVRNGDRVALIPPVSGG